MKEVVWFIRYVEAKSDATRQGCINEIAKIHGLSYAQAEKYAEIVLERARQF